ncbi:hypothetical protein CGRA01v4_07296 [Colletotrichum graminicola]|nr:hypothetical protein CGRA01v4_07296 [Colletotrichum graminicola]
MPVCSFVVIVSMLVATAGMLLVKKVAHAAGLSGLRIGDWGLVILPSPPF